AAWVPRDPLPECGESSGRDPRDMNHTKGGLVIFTANSHPSNRELGKRIAEDVNTTIMEMLIMVYACRTSCARSITGVLPYFPYSKQCKMRKRGSIVSKLIASMVCKAGK
ncbi:hypothetical protein XENOCAPTIV_021511, partial [Xenoophorus captivus]